MGQLILDLLPCSALSWLVELIIMKFLSQREDRGPLKSQAFIDNICSAFIDNGLYDLGYLVY